MRSRVFHESGAHKLDRSRPAGHVLLDRAAKHDRVAHPRRVGEAIVAGGTRLIIHAVDVEGISLPVVDGEIAVGGVGHRHHGAADAVALLGLGVVGQGISDTVDLGNGGVSDLGGLTSEATAADVIGQQVAGVNLLLIAGDLGEVIGRVGGGVGIHHNIVGSIIVDLPAEGAAVGGVTDEVIAVGGVDKFLLEIRTLDRAEDQGIVEGHDHLELGVGDLTHRQIVGASHRKEPAAQHHVVIREGLLAHLGVEVGHQLAEVVSRAVGVVVAQHRIACGDLIPIFFLQGLHDGIVGKMGVGSGGDQLGCGDLTPAVGEIDGSLGVGNALVVAAALKVVHTVAVGQDVSLVGVPLKDDIHVAFGENGVVVGRQGGIADAPRGGGAVAVMDGVDDKVRSRLAEGLRLGLDEVGQFPARFEVDASGHLPRDGGVAVTHGTDDTDTGTAPLDKHRGLAVGDPLVGIAVVDIDGQERKARQGGVVFNVGLAPIVLMIAEGHGGEVQVVHPLGDDVALGKIGLRASLPHIPCGEEEDVVLGLVGVFEVSGQLVHTDLSIGIEELTVEVVDGEEIQHDDHRNAAIVARAVIIFVGVILLRRQLGILGIQDALGGLGGSGGRLGIGDGTDGRRGGGMDAPIGGSLVTVLGRVGGDGDARIGIHTRGGDLGEDMGTGGEEDQECQEEGEENFFHRGLPFLIMKKSTRVGWIHMLAESVKRKTNF